ncbi:uncharacterized protein CMU_005710 [Cryptosporidium muris RN66]|uniref:Transmembrane protein n=1 Tax=Cryptosporidium muris (strain RN66) TaxID=441375 RepID=B6AHF3_CRYMR|nr:uncharacterized protein CMU_005710 [Cryptosporidium muris RN66]EEA07648.1 hypothetical protein, conserved [Cryptosporidium muris RN66]|eukprot:XP_002141997.1 hypothetical protein [Cryptosporidium muris RN66]
MSKYGILILLFYFLITIHKEVIAGDQKFTFSDPLESDSSLEVTPVIYNIYTNLVELILKKMFADEYEFRMENIDNIENPPLCRNNEQMVNKGCNIMLYSCSKLASEKFSCYFYYWSFCECNRPWIWSWLNYVIPPIYDCYPSIATDEDFTDLSMEEKGIFSKLKNIDFDTEELEIPVGECRVSGLFVLWILIVIVLLSYLAYQVYSFGLYIKIFMKSKKED